MIRGLMLVRCRGGSVFLFGYLYEPHSGASGAAHSGKLGGRVEVFSQHGGPKLKSGVNEKGLLVFRVLPECLPFGKREVPRGLH